VETKIATAEGYDAVLLPYDIGGIVWFNVELVYVVNVVYVVNA
jgi:hypothetical protein